MSELTFNVKEKGKSGTPIVSKNYENEYLAELSGPEGHVVYNKMRRSDPQVRKVLAAIANPIKSAKWYVEPVSDETQDIEAAALMEHILFNDIGRQFLIMQ